MGSESGKEQAMNPTEQVIDAAQRLTDAVSVAVKGGADVTGHSLDDGAEVFEDGEEIGQRSNAINFGCCCA
ncbi:hypothetical protein [Nonomuraea sp. NPDC005650]|uniref:hypothetical protein n=1 Tax=Nonomuraea sp. NPDC005650 TaxID=3157045 RepID=UPI0033AA00B9